MDQSVRSPDRKPVFATHYAGQARSYVVAMTIGKASQRRDRKVTLAILTAAALSAIVPTTAFGWGTFGDALLYDQEAQHIASGDFDNDHLTDLALLQGGPNGDRIALLRQRAHHGPLAPLADPFYVRFGGNATSIAMGDLTGDGRDDLVAVYDGGGVYVRRQKANGHYASAIGYRAQEGADNPVIARVDGDRRRDLVIPNRFSEQGTVTVLYQRPNGRHHLTGGNMWINANPQQTVVADVNSDGRSDLVTGHYFGRVTVKYQQRDGFGRLHLDKLDDPGIGVSSVDVGDLNGNGRLDIVATNSLGDTVSVWYQRHDGTFADAVDFAVGTGPNWVDVADVSRDGLRDVLSANSDESVSVLLQTEAGLQPQTEYPVGGYARQVVVADLNGDRRRDLALTAGGLNLLFNQP